MQPLTRQVLPCPYTRITQCPAVVCGLVLNGGRHLLICNSAHRQRTTRRRIAGRPDHPAGCRSIQRHRDREKPAKSCPAAAHGGAGQGIAGKPRQEAADGDAPFQPRHVEADAHVRARAEGQVTVGLARDVEPVGIGKLGRVAIGRADADGEIGARRDRYVRRPPRDAMVSRLPSWLGLSKRRNSSTAGRISSGWRSSRSLSSGHSSRA